MAQPLNERDGLWQLVTDTAGLAWCMASTQRRLFERLVSNLRGPNPVGDCGDTVAINLEVSGLPTVLAVPVEDIWSTYLPLVVLSASCSARQGGQRVIIGFAGAAASGKSTLCQLLRRIGNAWHSVMMATDCGVDEYRRAFGNDGSQTPCDDAAELFTVLSMDAYHRKNADLAAAGLSGVKGRLDTIDALAFAEDLGRVKRAITAAGGETLWLPEYDRRITHDPVAGVIPVTPAHRVVLVEGLYLLSGRPETPVSGGEREGAPAADDHSSPLQPHPAWMAVRTCLDVAVFLDTPLELCRSRAVMRKAGLTGACTSSGYGGSSAKPRMSLEASEAHFERVDLPVWRALQADKAQPCRGGLARLMQRSGQPIDADGSGTGPDVILAIAADSSNSGVKVAAATVRYAPWRPADQQLPPQTHHSSSARVLVTGLNPCVQRSLVFRGTAATKDCAALPLPSSSSSSNGGAAAACAITATTASHQPAWRRGDVNRASQAYVTCGGKGQHTALALARSRRDDSASNGSGDSDVRSTASRLSVQLAQFLGGPTGDQATGFLQRSFDDAVAPTGADGSSSTAAVAQLQQLTVCLRPVDQPTRTCTTVLDQSIGDMTELIEPSAAVEPSQVDALMGLLEGAVGCQACDDDDVTAPPLAAVALMGTVPPGAESVYSKIAALLCNAIGNVSRSGSDNGESPPCGAGSLSNSTSGYRATRPLVLLDAVKGVLPILTSGGISLLKINADELTCLYKEAATHPDYQTTVAAAAVGMPIASAVHISDSLLRSATVRLHAASLLACFSSGRAAADGSVIGGGLQTIAITDGPDAAHLFEVTSSSPLPSSPSLRLMHHSYSLPPLPGGRPVANPIGAGDTVAGVTLYHAAVAGAPLKVAFARGLAAGSASCLSMKGAVWDAGDAAAILLGISASSEQLTLLQL